MSVISRLLAPAMAGLVFAAALPAAAHETWLDAAPWQAAPGETVEVALRNGERFEGIELAWFGSRVARAEIVQNGSVMQIEGRAGDIPAITVTPGNSGLLTVVYQSNLRRLTYTEAGKFPAFVKHKDLTGTMARHAERGLPDTGFREGYTRFTKALIGIGGSAGADRAAGLETEFVAGANPYTDDLSGGMPVQLLYRGAPRADAQIEVFARPPADGAEVKVTRLRTDSEGRATISVAPGHTYLLDAVVIREPEPALAEEEGIVWETLWAALSFHVPD